VESNVRRYATAQTQSKPVYPYYHLDTTQPLPGKPRPSDAFRPWNILRSSTRQAQIRLPPSSSEKIDIISTKQARIVNPSAKPAMEEFIAVVFGNEVWMGLVDFKTEKPLPLQPIENDLEIRTCASICAFS
jgi:hypothetical protein